MAEDDGNPAMIQKESEPTTSVPENTLGDDGVEDGTGLAQEGNVEGALQETELTTSDADNVKTEKQITTAEVEGAEESTTEQVAPLEEERSNISQTPEEGRVTQSLFIQTAAREGEEVGQDIEQLESSSDEDESDLEETEKEEDVASDDKDSDVDKPKAGRLNLPSFIDIPLEDPTGMEVEQEACQTRLLFRDKVEFMWNKLRNDFKVSKEDMGDAGASMIDERMKEVYRMSKHMVPPSSILRELPPHLVTYIEKLSNQPTEEFTANHRKNWTGIDRFNYFIRMIVLVQRMCRVYQRHMWFVRQQDSNILLVEVPEKPSVMEDDQEAQKKSKYSIARDLRFSLIKRPRFRTDEDLKRIIYFLRQTKAFTHLFPAEMELEVARHVSYDIYDDGRLLAYQDRPADKFYYLISGRIHRVRRYEITTGEVNRSLGFTQKGMTSNPETLVNQTPRECYYVAKGLTEALILLKYNYFDFIKNYAVPPIDLLRKIDIFEEFPLELFHEHPEAIETRYFGPNQIVVKNSNKTGWLHIVKSGTVVVARRQRVFNLPPDSRFRTKKDQIISWEQKDSSAEALMGLPYRQRNFKRAGTVLPPLSPRKCLTHRPEKVHQGHGMKVCLTDLLRPASIKSMDNLYGIEELKPERQPTTIHVSDVDKDEEEESLGIISDSDDTVSFNESPISRSGPHFSASNGLGSKAKRYRVLSPMIRVAGEGFMSGRLPELEVDPAFFDRNETEMALILTGQVKQHVPERSTYVQVDVLRPMDVFGFNQLGRYKQNPDKSGSQNSDETEENLVLISQGAEVIRMSKRFFTEQAGNNTMLKVETMDKEYMSQVEAKGNLEERIKWIEYKKTLLGLMTSLHCYKRKRQDALVSM